MPDPKLDLSRVSRDALEALAANVLDPNAGLGIDKRIVSHIRAEATATLCYEGDCAKMTGSARPCPVHDDQPSPRTRAKDVDGWKLSYEYHGYVEYSRGNQDVSFDGEEIEARETVSGYNGWTAVVRIPVALMRELLPTLPRAELTGEERAVLEAWRAMPDELLGIWARYTEEHLSGDTRLQVEAELARRAAARKESKP